MTSLPVGVTTHPVEVFDTNYRGYHTVVCHACLWVERHKDYGLAVVAGRQHQSLFDTKEDTMTHTTPDAIDFTKRRWSHLISDAKSSVETAAEDLRIHTKRREEAEATLARREAYRDSLTLAHERWQDSIA